mmetsp:Transcript_118426/g.206107  ORF Transcript_118426/g.206107 Transcript_118426/m.206107 type:complete len:207 (+) Transcript_118426:587-1207(+)
MATAHLFEPSWKCSGLSNFATLLNFHGSCAIIDATFGKSCASLFNNRRTPSPLGCSNPTNHFSLLMFCMSFSSITIMRSLFFFLLSAILLTSSLVLLRRALHFICLSLDFPSGPWVKFSSFCSTNVASSQSICNSSFCWSISTISFFFNGPSCWVPFLVSFTSDTHFWVKNPSSSASPSSFGNSSFSPDFLSLLSESFSLSVFSCC